MSLTYFIVWIALRVLYIYCQYTVNVEDFNGAQMNVDLEKRTLNTYFWELHRYMHTGGHHPCIFVPPVSLASLYEDTVISQMSGTLQQMTSH